MEYSELRSLIIAVLAFCVPILAAIADKRAKAKKRSPQVKAEPIDFEELERRRQAASEGTRSIVRGPAATVPEPVEGQVIEGAALRRSSATVPAPKPAKEARSGQYPTAEEIKKDCKKIILYSEILKPKFDERD